MEKQLEMGSCNPSKSGGREMAHGRNGNHLVPAIWILSLLVAFLFGSTIANIIISKQAYEGTKVQTQTLRALNESIVEVRRSIAELTALLQEAQEPDRGADEENGFQMTRLGGEKI
jgi:hypothetical protein